MEAAVTHLKNDPALGPLLEWVQLPVAHPPEQVFPYLVESIISQQLAYKVAMTMLRRVRERVGIDLSAKAVLDTPVEEFRALGLSQKKAEYLHASATFQEQGELDVLRLHEMPDEQVIKHLTQIKGVGRWTAEMILMFPLNRPDVFPVGDWGILKAMQRLYGLSEDPKMLAKECIQVAERWSPYRTLACKILWNSQDGPPKVYE